MNTHKIIIKPTKISPSFHWSMNLVCQLSITSIYLSITSWIIWGVISILFHKKNGKIINNNFIVSLETSILIPNPSHLHYILPPLPPLHLHTPRFDSISSPGTFFFHLFYQFFFSSSNQFIKPYNAIRLSHCFFNFPHPGLLIYARVSLPTSFDQFIMTHILSQKNLYFFYYLL